MASALKNRIPTRYKTSATTSANTTDGETRRTRNNVVYMRTQSQTRTTGRVLLDAITNRLRAADLGQDEEATLCFLRSL